MDDIIEFSNGDHDYAHPALSDCMMYFVTAKVTQLVMNTVSCTLETSFAV